MTFQYGPGVTRFIDEKRHFPKPVPISDYVLLDRERCIQCARCTRFTAEIAGDGELAIEGRGNSAFISPFTVDGFQSKFSGNTVELCPVGALLSRKSRFASRPWEFHSQEDSICSNCGVGCNIAVQTRNNALYRVMARENNDVNEEWTCDRGKFELYWATSETRQTQPLLRRASRMMPGTWLDAMSALLGGLQSAGGDVAGLIGTKNSNEESYLFQKLFRFGLGSNNVDHRMYRFPILPMQTSIADIGRAKRIVAIGFDPKEYLPVIWLWIYKAISKHSAQYTQVDSADAPEVQSAIDSGEGSIILTSDRIDDDTAASLAGRCASSGAKINVLLPDVNSWGAIAMGVLPDRLPALKSVSNGSRPALETLWGGPIPQNTGLSTDQIFDGILAGSVKSLYLVGVDPVKSYHDPAKAKAALEKVPFLAVQDMFLTESAKMADVFLPSCSFIEKEGHFTNVEGRVQQFKSALRPLGDSRPDWQILCELIARLGKPVGYFSPADVSQEILAALANSGEAGN
jgi:NADH-quinone oxidoreductase subunit G